MPAGLLARGSNALSSLPDVGHTWPGQWRLRQRACRLQLRGQPRFWTFSSRTPSFETVWREIVLSAPYSHFHRRSLTRPGTVTPLTDQIGVAPSRAAGLERVRCIRTASKTNELRHGREVEQDRWAAPSHQPNRHDDQRHDAGDDQPAHTRRQQCRYVGIFNHDVSLAFTARAPWAISQPPAL